MTINEQLKSLLATGESMRSPVPVSLQDKNMDREFLTLATDILLLVERCQKQGIGDGNTIKRIAQELIKIKTEDI